MIEFRLTAISDADRKFIYDPYHTPEQFVTVAMRYRPSRPDFVGTDGNPYFFFGVDPDEPKAGYCIRWDAKVDAQGQYSWENVSLGEYLALRGGLGAILSESLGLGGEKPRSLEEIHTDINLIRLMGATEHIPQEALGGTWIDSGAGTGVATRTWARTVGIDTLVHVNENPLHELFARVTAFGEDATDLVVRHINDSIRNVPWYLRDANLTPINGIVCLNPVGGEQIQDTMALPERTDSAGVILLMHTDADLHETVRSFGELYGYRRIDGGDEPHSMQIYKSP